MARKTIKNLQSHLGTVVLTDSGSDGNDTMDEAEDIQAEVQQIDSLFEHQHVFKTNVRNFECLHWILFSNEF